MTPQEESKLVAKHQALVFKVARRAASTGAGSLDDCAQDANIAFLEACRDYDPAGGVTLGTFARRRMEWDVIAAYKARGREKRKHVAVSMDAVLDPEDPNPLTLHDIIGTPPTQEEEAEREQVSRALQRALKKLSAFERDIIRRHFFAGQTLEEIGRSVGYSREWVRLVQAKALETLRKALTDAGVDG